MIRNYLLAAGEVFLRSRDRYPDGTGSGIVNPTNNTFASFQGARLFKR